MYIRKYQSEDVIYWCKMYMDKHNIKKFPFFTSGGEEFWINEHTYFVTFNGQSERAVLASKEEEKMYWRYYKAWKLMNHE